MKKKSNQSRTSKHGVGFVSAWENNSPLTQVELDAVAELSLRIKDRPSLVKRKASAGVKKSTPPPPPTTTTTTATSSAATAATATATAATTATSTSIPIITTIDQFFQWFSKLEESQHSEEDAVYAKVLEHLQSLESQCNSICEKLDGSIDDLREIENQHLLVSTKTGELHSACEDLLDEQTRLLKFGDGVSSNLRYFNQLDELRQSLLLTSSVAGGGAVRDERFRLLLSRVDESLAFVERNDNFHDSKQYATKLRLLQARALNMVKSHVVSTLQAATSEILAAVHADKGSLALPGTSAAEASVFYVKFKSLSTRIKSLAALLEARASQRADYRSLLADCHACYFEQRRRLLQAVVDTNIADICRPLASSGGGGSGGSSGVDVVVVDDETAMLSIARNGSAYLVRICELEYNLYQFFFASTSESSSLTTLLDSFSASFYSRLRALFIRSRNLDLLCSLAHILGRECVQEQLVPRGESVAAFRHIVTRILQDVQERLIYVAQTHVRDSIDNFKPSEEDLNYPQKLLMATTKEKKTKKQQKQKHRREEEEGEEGGGDEEEEEEEKEEEEGTTKPESNESYYATWYPPLYRLLMMLSKLYLAIDIHVFEGIAQQGVSACVRSLCMASEQIAKQRTQLDSLLFLTRHLFILREQISPFDVDFAITESTLDFSNVRNVFSAVLAGRTSIWSFLSSPPRVLETRVDSRKDMEATLKTTLEKLILFVSRSLIEPLVSFQTKATAYLNVHTAGDERASSSLKEQAFARSERVEEMLRAFLQSIGDNNNDNDTAVSSSALVRFKHQAQVYFPPIRAASTLSLITTPVKHNLIDAIEKLRTLLTAHYGERLVQMLPSSSSELSAKLNKILE